MLAGLSGTDVEGIVEPGMDDPGTVDELSGFVAIVVDEAAARLDEGGVEPLSPRNLAAPNSAMPTTISSNTMIRVGGCFES